MLFSYLFSVIVMLICSTRREIVRFYWVANIHFSYSDHRFASGYASKNILDLILTVEENKIEFTLQGTVPSRPQMWFSQKIVISDGLKTILIDLILGQIR